MALEGWKNKEYSEKCNGGKEPNIMMVVLWTYAISLDPLLIRLSCDVVCLGNHHPSN